MHVLVQWILLLTIRMLTTYVFGLPLWTTLFGAVLRGTTANHDDVEYVLKGAGLDGEHLMSQLPCHCVEMFEVVKRGDWTYFISKPRTPTGEVVCVLYQSLCTVSIFSSSSCCRQ